MTFSLVFTADEKTSSLDWEQASDVLFEWAETHGITLPSEFSALTAGSELCLAISSGGRDLLKLFGALTESFSGLNINIAFEKKCDACLPESP
jgi:hypothetical protein